MPRTRSRVSACKRKLVGSSHCFPLPHATTWKRDKRAPHGRRQRLAGTKRGENVPHSSNRSMCGFVHVSFANATLDFCLGRRCRTGTRRWRESAHQTPHTASCVTQRAPGCYWRRPTRANPVQLTKDTQVRPMHRRAGGMAGVRADTRAPPAEREHLLQRERARDAEAPQVIPQLLRPQCPNREGGVNASQHAPLPRMHNICTISSRYSP